MPGHAPLIVCESLATCWTEIDAIGPVRERAESLLAVHALAAGDSVQPGNVLLLCGDRPGRFEVVVLDAQLASAAEAEGFRLVIPA